MRRPAVLVACALAATLCLAGCGDGDKARQAMEQEHVELDACRTTYPPGAAPFASLVRCEMGAVQNYVQLTDAQEHDKQARIADELEQRAAAVDRGDMTIEDWRSHAREVVGSLHDARRSTEAFSALL